MSENFTINMSYEEIFLIGKALIALSPDLSAREAGHAKSILETLNKCEVIHCRNLQKKNFNLSEEMLLTF